MNFAAPAFRSIALAFSLAAGAFALQGCATTQGEANNAASTEEAAEAPPDLSYIVKGTTTKAQLITKLGQPTKITVNGNNGETLTWGSSITKIDPRFYIPYVGSLIAGAKTQSKILTVNVDSKGIVIDHKYESSTQEVNRGM